MPFRIRGRKKDQGREEPEERTSVPADSPDLYEQDEDVPVIEPVESESAHPTYEDLIRGFEKGRQDDSKDDGA